MTNIVDTTVFGPEFPTVTVMVEGYNESNAQGTVTETMAALLKQRYPLEKIDVILAGSTEQAQAWDAIYSTGTPFASVRTLDAGSAHYYELKNRGAEMSQGDILVFTDSDVCPLPTWLPSIVQAIQNGADVTVGLSLFRGADGQTLEDPFLLSAASITFGWIVDKRRGGSIPQPQGFLAHNVAFRADVFRKHNYRTEFGRTCSSVFLFQELKAAGCKIALVPGQQASHYFEWDWWLSNFHYRVGYEVYQQRRVDSRTPSRWLSRAGILEPLITMMWHTYADLPRWFRYSRLLGIPAWKRLLLFPVVASLSVAARGAEMVGMYSTIRSPQLMRQWAERS